VRVTGLAVQALATGRAEAEQIAWEAETSRAAVAETVMPSAVDPEAPRVTTARAHAPAAAVVPRVRVLEEAVELVVVAAEGGAGEPPNSREWKS
jgi:hypothetical protein